MLTSRLWELGIGSLLAFYELKYGRVKHELLNQTMPLLGLAMIAYSIVFFNNQTPHPSFITLLPTLGTALIILFSVNTKDLVGKVLSWKPIVGVGLISYSMYLWHYPIFAFARIADVNGLHNDEKYLLILLTIALSIVSYFVIEKPFRNKQFMNLKKFSVSIFILLIAVLGVNWKVIEMKGFEKRIPKILNIEKNKLFKSLNLNGMSCHGRHESFCEFGINNKAYRSIIIVGDSQMRVIAYDLVDRVKDRYHIVDLTSPDCWLIEDHYSFINDPDGKSCSSDHQIKILNKIRSLPNSIIILGGRLPRMLNESWFDNLEGGQEKKDLKWKSYVFKSGITLEKSIQNTLMNIMNEGHKVILLYPIPEVGWHVPGELFKSFKKASNLEKVEALLSNRTFSTSYEVFKNRTLSSFNVLDNIKNKNLYRVYPHTLFCDTDLKNRCITHNNKKIFYRDGNHPSYDGSRAIVDLITIQLLRLEND